MSNKERHVNGIIRTTGPAGLRDATFLMTAVPAQPLGPGTERWTGSVTFQRDLRGRVRTLEQRFSFSTPVGATLEEWSEIAKTQVRVAGVGWPHLGQGSFQADFPQWAVNDVTPPLASPSTSRNPFRRRRGLR